MNMAVGVGDRLPEGIFSKSGGQEDRVGAEE